MPCIISKCLATLQSFSINQDKVPLSIPIGSISHTGNHNIPISQTVGSMGNRYTMIINFVGFSYVVDFGLPWVACNVNVVNSA